MSCSDKIAITVDGCCDYPKGVTKISIDPETFDMKDQNGNTLGNMKDMAQTVFLNPDGSEVEFH